MTDIIETTTGRDLATHETKPRRPSIEDVIGLWLSKYRSKKTREAYAAEIKAFARFVGRPEVEAATELLALDSAQAHAVTDSYRASMLNRKPIPYAPATISRAMSALNSFVKVARRYGVTTLHLNAQPETVINYRDTRGPGIEAIRAMLAVAGRDRNPWKATRNVAIIRVLFSLGLRNSELTGINLDDLDLSAGTIKILGKGEGDKRTLDVPPATLAAIKSWIEHRGSSAGPLFLSFDLKQRLSRPGLTLVVRKIGLAAGHSKVRPHGIRHTAVTTVLNASNGDVRRAQAFARHSNPNTTMIYDDNRQDLGGAAARLIDALME